MKFIELPTEPNNPSKSQNVKFPEFTLIVGVNGSGKTRYLNAVQNWYNQKNKSVAQGYETNRTVVSAQKGLTTQGVYPAAQSVASKKDTIEQSYGAISKWLLNDKIPHGLLETGRINNDQQLSSMQVNLLRRLHKIKKKTDKVPNVDQFVSTLSRREMYYLAGVHYGHVNVAQAGAIYLYLVQQNKKQIVAKEMGFEAYPRDEAELLAALGPPPWEEFNQLLAELDIPYRMQEPDQSQDHYSGELVRLGEMNASNPALFSAGEKVIYSLAQSVFSLSFDAISKPELVLLDEADAHLHPAACGVLVKSLVEKVAPMFKQGVIMVSHNPTAVAFAPDESVFVMKRGINFPEKVSKQAALAEMCVGIPNMSISFDDRRQVWVEGRFDAKIYEKSYSLLAREEQSLREGPSLNFLATADDNEGGCDRVRRLSNELHANGLETVRGVIDWDTKNTSQGNVCVFAEDIFYSLENALLIPDLLIGYLAHRKSDEGWGVFDAVSVNWRTFVTDEGRQSRSDEFSEILLNLMVSKGTEAQKRRLEEQFSTQRPVVQFDGFELLVPEYFLRKKGHELADELLNFAPQLKNGLGGKQSDRLCEEIVTHVLGNAPERIPCAFLQLFQTLQN